LAKFQVSDPLGSIFKKFPKIAYTLTLWNQRSAIKSPIGVHNHIIIDMCCVDTDFGSTDRRSHFCSQRFGCKKIKSLVKNFFNAIQWRKLTFLLDVRFKRLAGGSNGTHISNTHHKSFNWCESPPSGHLPKSERCHDFKKKKKFPIMRISIKLK
jgi:hypothetical protein